MADRPVSGVAGSGRSPPCLVLYAVQGLRRGLVVLDALVPATQIVFSRAPDIGYFAPSMHAVACKLFASPCIRAARRPEGLSFRCLVGRTVTTSPSMRWLSTSVVKSKRRTRGSVLAAVLQCGCAWYRLWHHGSAFELTPTSAGGETAASTAHQRCPCSRSAGQRGLGVS
jgi:hypothetical protein